MNRHDRQMRDDLAKRLFVAMFSSVGDRLHNHESAVEWSYEAGKMAAECFVISGIWMEKRTIQHEVDDEFERESQRHDEEVEL